MGAVERVFAAGAVAATLAVASAGPAMADEPEESREARDLVLQSIALIVNTPEEMHEIEERIEHALDTSHTEGVDLEVVEEAATALEAGDLQRTRELLQISIGAGPFLGTGVPEPVREVSGEPGQPAFAVGSEAGTMVVLDEYRANTALDGGDVVLIILSAIAIALGTLMVWWSWRPAGMHRLGADALRRES